MAKYHSKILTGDKIDYSGFVYAPINELGVVCLFGKLADKLGFEITIIRSAFPDCIARRKISNNKWQECKIEFEYTSKNFFLHKHDPEKCDIIVCWYNDWESCPDKIEIIELKNVIWRLKNGISPLGAKPQKSTNDILIEIKKNKKNPLLKAESIKKLMKDEKLKQYEIADLMNVKEGVVSRHLSLLKLPPLLQNELKDNKIPEYIAYKLGKISPFYIEEAYELYKSGEKIEKIIQKYPKSKKDIKWFKHSKFFNEK